MQFFTDEELNKEIEALEAGERPPAFAGRKYPIEYLQARDFEILLYFIFKKEIELGLHRDKYDTVRLMKGVAERGRDNVLIHQGKNVAAVQCKRYGRPLTRPECAREIIKFLLHALQDSNLISDKENFTYLLVSLEGFNEKALNLLNNFKSDSSKDEELESWTNEVIRDNEGITFKTFSDVKDRLLDLIQSINIEIITGTDIDGKLRLLKDVIPIFFEVEKVVSASMLDEKFKQYFDFTTDEDLNKLRTRIGQLPEDKKMRFGLFNLYGYDLNFYRKLARDREVILKFADLKSSLDQRFIQYLQETIQRFQLLFVSGLPNISPFTKQVAITYLFNKYAVQFHDNTSGKFLASFTKKNSLIYEMQTIEQIKVELLRVGDLVLRSDYSSFDGDEELVNLKRQILEQIHRGFTSVQEMSDRFDQDMIDLLPIIKVIEEKVKEIMPSNPTIIIGDFGLQTEQDFVDMLKKAKEYE